MNKTILARLLMLVSVLSANDSDVRFDAIGDSARSVKISTTTARLTVREWSFDGEPVILIHGGPGVPDYLEPIARILKNDFHVITYDQRGTGDSQASNASYSVPDHLKDLQTIINHFGFNRVHLFGHSWGGLLAQLYASQHPEEVISLFLCNSATGVGADWKRMEKQVMAYNKKQAGFWGFSKMGVYSLLAMIPGPIGDKASREMFKIVWSNYFHDPNDAPEPDKSWLRGIHSPAGLKTRKSILSMEAEDLIKIPLLPDARVLILFGGYDIYGVESERLINRFPRAEAILLESSGHLPWIQDEEHFIPVLYSFYVTIQAQAKAKAKK